MNDKFITKEQEVECKIIKAYCSHCKKGELVDTGEALLTNPPQFKYKCYNCGAEYYSVNIYPKIEYIPVDDNDDISIEPFDYDTEEV